MIIIALSVFLVACTNETAEQGTTEHFTIGPELKNCTGIGPQKCMVVNGEYFYDSIRGFDYQEGYDYEITVKKQMREDVPADASTYTYTLVDIISKNPAIPANCTSWFDGCNTCTAHNGTLGGCTRKYCPEETMGTPACLSTE